MADLKKVCSSRLTGPRNFFQKINLLIFVFFFSLFQTFCQYLPFSFLICTIYMNTRSIRDDNAAYFQIKNTNVFK